MLQGSSPQASVLAARVTITGPFPPGKLVAQVGFSLPNAGANLALTQKWPAALSQIFVAAEKIGPTARDWAMQSMVRSFPPLWPSSTPPSPTSSSSQNQTTRDSLVGRILSGVEAGYRVHLFARNGKLRNGRAAPFLYCGNPRFEGWEGERPITVTWKLGDAVPNHLQKTLGILL